jgi:hypothetical protein
VKRCPAPQDGRQRLRGNASGLLWVSGSNTRIMTAQNRAWPPRRFAIYGQFTEAIDCDCHIASVPRTWQCVTYTWREWDGK